MDLSERMSLIRDHAALAQHEKRHIFGVTGVGVKGPASPRLSPSGSLYFDCEKCGRSLIEGPDLQGSPSGTAYEKAC